MTELIKTIIDAEWEMFHNVNGEERTSCQNNQKQFIMMRESQFKAWSEEACSSYLQDLKDAKAAGRSLLRDKYIWMMKSTAPEDFEELKSELPEVSEKKESLINELSEILLKQTEKMRREYPMLAVGARPLYASEEQDWPSVETYQKGELLTYSEKTVEALLKHVKELEAKGVDMALEIQKNITESYGYKDMSDAEFVLSLMAEDLSKMPDDELHEYEERIHAVKLG